MKYSPLIFDPTFSDRYYVDWTRVKEHLINMNALS
jgi:hypothetical protein